MRNTFINCNCYEKMISLLKHRTIYIISLHYESIKMYNYPDHSIDIKLLETVKIEKR